jgi:cytochrome P450
MSCPYHSEPDPFKESRQNDGVLVNEYQGNAIPLILRHADLRQAAKDWETYSSDAPFKVPIPTEEEVRTVRQLPLEVDPPDQKDYRAIAQPFFDRPRLPEVIAAVEQLVSRLLDEALRRDSLEIVREFAIPLQSKALAILTNMPEEEADIWIGWGTHVFREGDGTSKGAALEEYTNGLLDRAAANPGDDFFSALTQAEFRGRKLTREEMLGFCSIMFAGGRDTVINTISGIIAHLSNKPDDFEFLREDESRLKLAVEEFFRAISPVTHLARKCPVGADVHGVKVDPGEFVSLCFASANYDGTVFDAPEEVRLDRKPNPHVAFGFGPHVCLGAHHARLVARSLIDALCKKVARIETLAAEPKYERETRYHRRLAYDSLEVRFTAR